MSSDAKVDVLVLGGAGYIGSVLCPVLLDAGYRVRCVDSLRYNNGASLASFFSRPNFSFRRMNICDISCLRQELKQADIVVNLAALVGAPVCDKYPAEAVAVNQDAAIEVAKRLSKHQRLIFLNTNSGYGQSYVPVTESSPLNPVSLYGKTKVYAEQQCLENHPNCVSLRLATVCGLSPRMRFDLLVNDWTYTLASGNNLTIYEPNFMRNYVAIEDVAMAILFFMRHAIRVSGPFNLGNDNWNLSKKDLAATICREVGMDFTSCIAFGDGKDPDARNYTVSNHKIKSIGFSCQENLPETIKKVANFVIATQPKKTGNMSYE